MHSDFLKGGFDTQIIILKESSLMPPMIYLLVKSKASTTRSKRFADRGMDIRMMNNFFLKLFDMSRRDYVRNPKSHKFCD